MFRCDQYKDSACKIKKSLPMLCGRPSIQFVKVEISLPMDVWLSYSLSSSREICPRVCASTYGGQCMLKVVIPSVYHEFFFIFLLFQVILSLTCGIRKGLPRAVISPQSAQGCVISLHFCLSSSRERGQPQDV